MESTLLRPSMMTWFDRKIVNHFYHKKSKFCNLRSQSFYFIKFVDQAYRNHLNRQASERTRFGSDRSSVPYSATMSHRSTPTSGIRESELAPPLPYTSSPELLPQAAPQQQPGRPLSAYRRQQAMPTPARATTAYTAAPWDSFDPEMDRDFIV
jgi:hypothetical protein